MDEKYGVEEVNGQLEQLKLRYTSFMWRAYESSEMVILNQIRFPGEWNLRYIKEISII
jgi:hypothetical protein